MWVRQGARQQSFASAEQVVASKLSLYSKPPEEAVSIEDFEGFAIDRLKVLKGFEDAKARGTKFKDQPEKARQLLKHLSAKRASDSQKKDVVSHFVLRLAYCRTDELRRWFVSQECDLFRFRFSQEPPSSQAAFLKEHDLPFASLSAGELEEVKPDFIQLLHSTYRKEQATDFANNLNTDSVFKVPWEQVPDLVALRKVLLRQGVAFVHKKEMGSLVANHFKMQLSRAMNLTARKWVNHLAAEEQGRLTPIVESLSLRYLGPDFGGNEDGPKEVVTRRQLPALSNQSFPLCMQTMMSGLREKHHLKHNARQQLGLFLKGIGLPLEEALSFWRSEFAPLTPSDQFDKKYAYNVRHGYGKEGRRAAYTPHACRTIISSVAGQTDFHGCPYKTFSAEQLGATLSKLRIEPQRVRETVKKAKEGHFQLACAMAFEGVHKCECETGINHPNQYFVESRKAFVAKTGADGSTERGVAAAGGVQF